MTSVLPPIALSSPAIQGTPSKSPVFRSASPRPTSLSPPTTAATTEKETKKGRRVSIGKGCGLLDWIRLCRTQKDLPGTGGKHLQVTEEELAKHNTPDDAWTAIRGKVYNLTPYMRFHPGGTDQLMRGAGMDCTALFDDVHKWVNVESMLSKCVVGTLVATTPTIMRRSSSLSLKSRGRSDSLTVPRPTMVIDGMNKQAVPKRKLTRTNSQAAEACEENDGTRQVSPESPVKTLVQELPSSTQEVGPISEDEGGTDLPVTLTVPALRVRKNSDTSKPNPRFNWVDSERSVNIHIVTQYQTVKPSDVVVAMNGKVFEAEVFLNDWVYELNIALTHPVYDSQVSINAGKVEIKLLKTNPSKCWEKLGSFLPGHGISTPKIKKEPKFHYSTVESIRDVTHDTKLFTVKFPPGYHVSVPTGHHAIIQATVDGETVERSYTPVVPLNGHSYSDGQTIQFMIKLYKNGKMSQFLSRLKQGDQLLVSSPDGTFDASRLNTTDDILLIAAGTGITPMVKVIRDYLAVESGPNARRSAKFLFANKTEKDILWREELNELTKNTGFKMVNVLSEADNSWEGLKGRITSSLLKEHLPSPSSDRKTLVCICGPTAFTTGLSNALWDMGVSDDNIHCFT